jgi:hypothetical protein
MTLVDIVGWLAACFTLAAYSMRTMVPLRIAAIGANLSFITFGALDATLPILALHAVLLPFNIYRLWELLRGIRAARAARRKEPDFTWLRDVASPGLYRDGAHVFRKGDRPDKLYYIDAGQVLLEEIGVTLSPQEIFGEIAFFTDAQQRTVSARCIGSCRIFAIDEARFVTLYHQNPTFGFAIVQLIAKRLMHGIETRPEAYLPVTPDEPRPPC